MRVESGSTARLGGLAGASAHRQQKGGDRWPILASVSFVIVFNLVAWGSIALGLYAVL